MVLPAHCAGSMSSIPGMTTGATDVLEREGGLGVTVGHWANI